MRLDLPFTELEAMVLKMGATPIQWRSGVAELLGGVEIELDDLEFTDEGLLTYKGEHILLYIKDTRHSKETNEKYPENSRRFHVADCSTIEGMIAGDRLDRYIVTTNISGEFSVFYHGLFSKQWWEKDDGETGETVAELKVCKMCLRHLNYNEYNNATPAQKIEVWTGFSISEFFETYKSHFNQKPKFNDKTMPDPGYSDNWDEISKNYRRSVGFKCEGCDVYLGGHKNLLHVHHKNGVQGDNDSSNLEALCILCHSKQPQHGHMHIKPKDKVSILALRREQKPSDQPKSDFKNGPSNRTRPREHTPPQPGLFD